MVAPNWPIWKIAHRVPSYPILNYDNSRGKGLSEVVEKLTTHRKLPNRGG
jgi:hypothetical protein